MTASRPDHNTVSVPIPVGILGVGNMGGAMAGRLLELGWTVRVCDLVDARVQPLQALGAVACANGAAVADGAGAVIVAVVDAAQTREVLFGAGGVAEGLAAGAAVLLCPTIGADDVVRIGLRLQERGLTVIDAPMSGGPARAREGSMSLTVACSDPVFSAHQPLLQALSSRVFRVGSRLGDGARTKLVNNLLAGTNLVAACEALALAQAWGLDLSVTLDVIEQSSGQSWIGGDRLRRVLAGDAAPRAHLSLLTKDTRLAMEGATSSGFHGPLGAAVASVFARACDDGLAGEDDSVLFRHIAKS